jgi:hypothetical protein
MLLSAINQSQVHKSPFQCESLRGQDVQRVFVQRSVAIITAALSHNTAALRPMVAAAATSAIFHYDNGITSRTNGPQSVIDLIDDIAPRHYEYFHARGISGPRQDPCGTISVELTLTSMKSDEASQLVLKFQGGLLVETQVWDADYVAGTLPRSSR